MPKDFRKPRTSCHGLEDVTTQSTDTEVVFAILGQDCGNGIRIGIILVLLPPQPASNRLSMQHGFRTQKLIMSSERRCPLLQLHTHNLVGKPTKPSTAWHGYNYDHPCMCSSQVENKCVHRRSSAFQLHKTSSREYAQADE